MVADGGIAVRHVSGIEIAVYVCELVGKTEDTAVVVFLVGWHFAVIGAIGKFMSV